MQWSHPIKLVMSDVYVKSCQAQCADDFYPKSTGTGELLVQQMHAVHHSELVDIDDDGHLVRVYIRLGTRWINQVKEDESDIKAFIEADFTAEHQLTPELEQ